MPIAYQTLPRDTDNCLALKPAHRDFYQRLLVDMANPLVQREAANLLDETMLQTDPFAGDLPHKPHDLQGWMEDGFRTTTAKYSAYLEKRKQGGARSYFTNRAHALYFLRAVAPTKLVDGAWLYGVVKHWQNSKLTDLLHTYLEELGAGTPEKNHVAIYKSLLSSQRLDLADDLDDQFYAQGRIQLALAANATHYLPEIIGFNLGYEQLALHLLITAYELNEIGIDPYYFTLHITADNSDTGHARRAVRAVLDNLPKLGCPDEFWRRVRLGYGLSNVGMGTAEVISRFDINQEVIRIFSRKAAAGCGVHSNYCRIAGRHVNDWLQHKQELPEFLAALQKSGWINRGMPVKSSRFWGLLEGPRADMWGVFTAYELQMIHDWIRGDASVDARAYTQAATHELTSIRPSYKVAARQARGDDEPSSNDHRANTAEPLDEDLLQLTKELQNLNGVEQEALLIKAMSPALHWTPAGLHATQLFCQMFYKESRANRPHLAPATALP